MEKPARNKLLLGTAIVLTLGLAWYGWKYWGWFGGEQSEREKWVDDCVKKMAKSGVTIPNYKEHCEAKWDNEHKDTEGFPSNPKDQDKFTKDGKVYIFRAIQCITTPCEGGTWVLFNEGDTPAENRSFAVGGQVSPILKYRTINVVNRFGVMVGGSHDGEIGNEAVWHKIGTIFTGREKTIKYKNNGWVTGAVIEVAPNLYIWKKDVVVNPEVKTEFALGGNVSIPVHKNWNYSKVDVWLKNQQGNTIKLSGGAIPAIFKKGDPILVNMKDASGITAIAINQEHILDINNSQGWMVVSLYSSSMTPQWVGGIVQKV